GGASRAGWPTCSTARAATRTPGRSRTWWPCWTATPERCWRSRTVRWCPSPGTPAGTTRPAWRNPARWRPCTSCSPTVRVSLHPIEGLVLHQIGYLDHGRLRPIIYRASLSEMVVPYGSTAMNHWWKNAFDAGDVGLREMANRRALGCECLGEIVYLG